ncbi:cyclin-dependent protein kinase inhibitor SMR4-like [Beta vulgaris subsp. vulgaris]|uniref:cyclin-dependent protein kinase inhibitor SMR4-like n=1 Tax=Beta vulgaris subsp. vulgaris TaxID=3555 RepID=UPI002036F979|nr:cyclin-dependent protein kinase inhibitor SMR4-like [Beta vulgaris subsp. vulgaris]
MEGKENVRVEFEFEFESDCRTPRHGKIPAALVCPPPPRKKRVYANKSVVLPPKGGFFQPPDLELIFTSSNVKQGKFVGYR